MIESARLVVLLDLLDALRWQDGLSQGLTRHLFVEVGQIALVPHCRHKGRLDSLLEQFFHVNIREEWVHQDLVHILILAESIPAVFV